MNENEYLLKYNKAISLIHQGHYQEAEKILRGIIQTGHMLSNWALGLIYASTGRPYAALKQWEIISPVEINAVSGKIEKILKHLQTYDEIFKLYHKSIEKGGQKDVVSLSQMYEEMLKKGEGISLPVEIYKGLFLSLLVQGNTDQFYKALNKAPEYVRNDVAIKAIELKVKESKLESKATQLDKKSVKKNRLATGFVLTGAAVLVLAAGVLMDKFGDNEKAQPVSAIKQSNLSNNIGNVHDKELKDKITSLVKENSVLQAEVEKKSSELQKNSERTSLLELAEVDTEKLKENAAVKLYQSGLESYRNDRFQEAAEKFSKTLSISKSTFFADDAHFFLINSLIKKGDKVTADTEMDAFLKDSGTVPYKQSPYLDDVMLLRAESYLQSGDKESARKWLDRIESDYPNEWTSQKAKSLKSDT